jgi:uncharacterized MAPEG superfamily protein
MYSASAREAGRYCAVILLPAREKRWVNIGGERMSTELYWLVLTVGMTGLFWVPYILDRFATRGIMGTLGYPEPDTPPQSEWAERMRHAHGNAVENLAIFAPLVLVTQALNVHTGVTAAACVIYFWARLAHFVIYALKIPVLRTLAFLVGWGAQVALFLAVI